MTPYKSDISELLKAKKCLQCKKKPAKFGSFFCSNECLLKYNVKDFDAAEKVSLNPIKEEGGRRTKFSVTS